MGRLRKTGGDRETGGGLILLLSLRLDKMYGVASQHLTFPVKRTRYGKPALLLMEVRIGARS
jgi:hypothetical protein